MIKLPSYHLWGIVITAVALFGTSCKKDRNKTICQNMAEKSKKYDIVPKDALGARYYIVGFGKTKNGKKIEKDEKLSTHLQNTIAQSHRDIRFTSDNEIGGWVGDNIYGNWSLPRTEESFALRAVIFQLSFQQMPELAHKMHNAVNSCRCYSYKGEEGELFKKEKIYLYYPEDENNIIILERYQ